MQRPPGGGGRERGPGAGPDAGTPGRHAPRGSPQPERGREDWSRSGEASGGAVLRWPRGRRRVPGLLSAGAERVVVSRKRHLDYTGRALASRVCLTPWQAEPWPWSQISGSGLSGLRWGHGGQRKGAKPPKANGVLPSPLGVLLKTRLALPASGRARLTAPTEPGHLPGVAVLLPGPAGSGPDSPVLPARSCRSTGKLSWTQPLSLVWGEGLQLRAQAAAGKGWRGRLDAGKCPSWPLRAPTKGFPGTRAPAANRRTLTRARDNVLENNPGRLRAGGRGAGVAESAPPGWARLGPAPHGVPRSREGGTPAADTPPPACPQTPEAAHGPVGICGHKGRLSGVRLPPPVLTQPQSKTPGLALSP